MTLELAMLDSWYLHLRQAKLGQVYFPMENIILALFSNI